MKIKRFSQSEIDRNNLSLCKVVEGQEKDLFDYSNIVVEKPWGYEYLMYENSSVAIWILHLKKGHGTSMHCHPNKKTSLVVLSGKIRGKTLSEWFDLDALSGVIYEKGVFHTSKALEDDTFIMEIETPPNKKDLARLKDEYGRETKGYEGKNKMSKKLSDYKHIFVDDVSTDTEVRKRINNITISLKKNILKKIDKKSNHLEAAIHCLLDDCDTPANKKSIFDTGNIFHSDHIDLKNEIFASNNGLLMSISREEKK